MDVFVQRGSKGVATVTNSLRRFFSNYPLMPANQIEVSKEEERWKRNSKRAMNGAPIIHRHYVLHSS